LREDSTSSPHPEGEGRINRAVRKWQVIDGAQSNYALLAESVNSGINDFEERFAYFRKKLKKPEGIVDFSD
jgi:hypothetical protein